MEKLVYALWGVHEGLVEKAGPGAARRSIRTA